MNKLTNEEIKNFFTKFYERNLLINMNNDIFHKYEKEEIKFFNLSNHIYIELKTGFNKLHAGHNSVYEHKEKSSLIGSLNKELYLIYEELLFNLKLLKEYKILDSFFEKKAEKECKNNNTPQRTESNYEYDNFPEYDEYYLFLMPAIDTIKELLTEEYYNIGNEVLNDLMEKNNMNMNSIQLKIK